MTTIPSLDEQIAEEELLIRLYEAELHRLRRDQPPQQEGREEQDAGSIDDAFVRSPRTERNQEEDHSDKVEKVNHQEDSLMEWMLQDNESAQDILANNASLDAAPLVNMNGMQAILTGFCIESVIRLLQPSSKDHRELHEVYQLSGYFIDDPSLGARIRMELVADVTNEEEPTKTTSDERASKKMETKLSKRHLRISSLEFGLEARSSGAQSSNDTRNDGDISWLQHHVAAANTFDPLNLAHWIDCTKRYLRFCNQRQIFLHQHASHIVVLEQANSKITLELLLPNETLQTAAPGQDAAPGMRLIWDWSWKHETDTLKLLETTQAPLSFHRNGLTQLVKLSGSCQAAMEIMLPGPKRARARRRVANSTSDGSYADDENEDSDDDLLFHGDDDNDSSSEEKLKGKRKQTPKEPVRQLSEYELQRLERIKRNEAYFASLGLNGAREALLEEAKPKRRKKEQPVEDTAKES